MKILICCQTMSYLSGSPLYNFTLAKELSKSHQVDVLSNWINDQHDPEGHWLKDILVENNVGILSWNEYIPQDYDLIIVSQKQELITKYLPDVPIINVVHSEYDCEEPLPDSNQIIKYVCIRPEIIEHITQNHNIPLFKCELIYNGVDRERFKAKEKTKRDYYKIVIPCTIDELRLKFLQHMIDGATSERRIEIYGLDYGHILKTNEWVSINPPKFNIEDYIADADEVAGILLGRVNIEAWSCGVKSSIYDPVTLECHTYETPDNFDETFNIKNTVNKLLSIYERRMFKQPSREKLADIIIPHHDATKHLMNCLDSIPIKPYNVIISRGGSFAYNCNKAARLAETDWLIFVNDDTITNKKALNELINNPNPLVGVPQYDRDGNLRLIGIGFDDMQDEIVSTRENVLIPSGGYFKIKRDLFNEMGGFDERFVNGHEDLDLFLRCLEHGIKPDYTQNGIVHLESMSTGRFDKLTANVMLFNILWPKERLLNLFKKIGYNNLWKNGNQK